MFGFPTYPHPASNVTLAVYSAANHRGASAIIYRADVAAERKI